MGNKHSGSGCVQVPRQNSALSVWKQQRSQVVAEEWKRGKALEAEVRGSSETDDIEPCRPIKLWSFTVNHMGNHWRVRAEELHCWCQLSKEPLWLLCEERSIEGSGNTQEDHFKPVPLISVKFKGGGGVKSVDGFRRLGQYNLLMDWIFNRSYLSWSQKLRKW